MRIINNESKEIMEFIVTGLLGQTRTNCMIGETCAIRNPDSTTVDELLGKTLFNSVLDQGEGI